MNPRLKQTAKGVTKGPTPAELLARMPRRPLSVEQQAAALEKVQQQATQRVKLGQQLFEAADAKLQQHQELLKEIQSQQEVLREKVQEDVAKSLQSYDQWMGKIDESFTHEVRKLNERIDRLELRVDASRGELEAMIEKATALMSQTQGLMAEAFEGQPATLEFSKQLDQPASATRAQSAAELVADEMRQSIPQDPHCDVDALLDPSMRYEAGPIDREALRYEADSESLEVDLASPTPTVSMGKQSPEPTPERGESVPEQAPAADNGDVFGEVLRRLRKQVEEDGQDAAA